MTPAGWTARILALEPLDLAIQLVENASGEPTERTVHELRKALKRSRALMRLLRTQLPRKEFARANASLRHCGRRLAGARDAEILILALDRLVKRHPEQLAESRGIARLRARLVAEREWVTDATVKDSVALELISSELGGLRGRVAGWPLPEADLPPARDGLARIYREGHGRRRVARGDSSTENLHAWRKRVKDLRFAAEALDPDSPRLRRVARRAEELAELLGEEHDLSLLAERVLSDAICFSGERAIRKHLLVLIGTRRKRLTRAALKLGKKLYLESPRRFMRRLERR